MGFNERVLSEARDKSIPLFERLKFLSITASNLNEIFHDTCSFFKGYGSRKNTKIEHCRSVTKRTVSSAGTGNEKI